MRHRMPGQRVALRQLTVQFGQLRLQSGELPGPVMAATIQLLFQGIRSLCIGGALLSGGDQGRDAPFQLGVLADGQVILPDKGAALKDLPADAQQGLAAGGTGQARHRLVGTGVYGTEFPHGAGLPPGGAGQSQLPQFRAAVHPAGHGRA